MYLLSATGPESFADRVYRPGFWYDIRQNPEGKRRLSKTTARRDVYLDNAATTYPKPEPVLKAMDHFSREVGGNPGRSGHHRSLEAGRVVLRARDALAILLGASDPTRVVLVKNATEALNIAIKGVLGGGGHAVVSCLEHNSVWRPLESLAARGVTYTVVPCREDGCVEPATVLEAITPDTKLLIFMHASNVIGTLLPVADLAAVARERGIPLLVDAAQTAGCYPIDVEGMGIDLLAFTGHKELFGPQGTGGLYLAEGLELPPLLEGGTGSNSRDPHQPEFLPDRFEAGTPNGVGLAGLHAGVEFILQEGLDRIRGHVEELTTRLMEGLRAQPHMTLYGTADAAGRVGIASFNVQGFDSSEVASLLDERYGICVRSGLHCAPLAHRALGTLERGTVRASISYLSTAADVDYLLDCIRPLKDL